jgi:hypothetical protein
MASLKNHEAGVVDKNAPPEMETSPVHKEQSMDEEDAGVAYHQSLKGHTKNDRADMSRMGKTQELRV